MFSQYLKYLIEKLLFFRVVIARLFIILFRKRRDIELLHLDYNKEHLFETSYMVINYRFRNAIYYRFGKHLTLEKKIKIFNINNFENEFDLLVYGFFQKKAYRIQFEPTLTLNNTSFKTTFSNLTLENKVLNGPNINCKIEKPIIRTKKIKIKIKTNSFNKNEFI